jgi:molecular chaperone Hsp33
MPDEYPAVRSSARFESRSPVGMHDQDQLFRFTFEHLGVRGELVHLAASWRAVLDRHDYPSPVGKQLGQALASVLLLSGTIKFKGSLILQIQGEGPLATLVAQATDDRTVRGMAHWRGVVPDAALPEVFGAGRLVLSADKGGERYQGVVGLDGERLADAFEGYFRQSEQLPTRLWLAADGERAAGLLLQRLPSGHGDDEDWSRIGMLAETVTDVELLGLPAEDLLRRLFHEEQVRLYEPEPVAFRCQCSVERIESALRGMGREEVEGIIAEQGEVRAHCEFCNREYRFDRIDVEHLFAEGASPQGSDTRH